MIYKHTRVSHSIYCIFVTTTALFSLFLTSCASQPVYDLPDLAERIPAQTWAWECERNFAFVARREGDAMWLFLPSHAVQLPRIKDDDGASYRSANIRFHQKNGQAQLELPDGRYEHCQNNIQRAAWEHARLNGVDFRATGNAPDWVLEITLDGGIQLTMSPGDTTYSFATPEPLVIESDRKTLYSTQNKANQIIVELTGTSCRDTSTGETREVTVNISIDDNRLKGCGGALH